MSTDRILVHSSIATKFLSALKGSLETKSKETPEWPTLVTEAAKERVESLITEALVSGAEVIHWTPRVEESSNSSGIRVPRVILGNIRDHMDVWQEESFAPLAAVKIFHHEEEAVRMANDGGYGLSAAIFTEDLRRGFALAKKIQAG